MKQTTSIRLSSTEKQSINEATEKMGISAGEYFVRLHYAFWNIAKSMMEKRIEDDLSKEQGFIKKLKELGVIEDGRNARI